VALTPVRIEPRFRRRLRKKPPEMRRAVEDAVTQLRKDPHHKGLRTHRVWGQKGVWEARIDAGNRLTFQWDGPEIVLLNHCHHDILKKP
jgi:mRNA-degrading endonuclease RelE of RelBE toxin-antitoxin system